ncbi:MAG TPA: hypothetical protein VG796_29250 [Verrucomicrobiales bacterium]|jgi:hypothetical protein|nr:hypothetical protein [Verrucomicrobiales bacterium]
MKALLSFLLFLLKVAVALIIVNVLLPVGMVWGIVMLFRWSWRLLTPESRYCRHCRPRWEKFDPVRECGHQPS